MTTWKNLQIDVDSGAERAVVPPSTGAITITVVNDISAMIPGNLVTLSGTGANPSAALASNVVAKADAYVINPGTTAGDGTVGLNGIAAITSATAGTEYFLGTAGAAVTTPGGTILQSVGYAAYATGLNFVPGIPVA
jgi:hypothetical protein